MACPDHNSRECSFKRIPVQHSGTTQLPGIRSSPNSHAWFFSVRTTCLWCSDPVFLLGLPALPPHQRKRAPSEGEPVSLVGDIDRVLREYCRRFGPSRVSDEYRAYILRSGMRWGEGERSMWRGRKWMLWLGGRFSRRWGGPRAKQTDENTPPLSGLVLLTAARFSCGAAHVFAYRLFDCARLVGRR